jgi:hypothetical protein
MPKAPSPTAAAQEEHTLWNSFKVYVFFLNNIHYGIVLKNYALFASSMKHIVQMKEKKHRKNP